MIAEELADKSICEINTPAGLTEARQKLHEIVRTKWLC